MGQPHLGRLPQDLSGPLKKGNRLTRGEDGSQGWVCRDYGRHFSLKGWSECENVDWDWLALSQVREGTQSHAERPRQHDGGSRMVVLPASRVLQMYCTATITLLFWESLLSSENEMDTAVGLNDIAHLSDLQGEGGIFEWFLHLSGAEGTEIPTFASRAAVRELCCELGEFLVGSVDLSFVTLEDLDSFGL